MTSRFFSRFFGITIGLLPVKFDLKAEMGAR